MLSKKENLDSTCPASVIQHLLFKEHNTEHEINMQAESVQQNSFPSFKTSSLWCKPLSTAICLVSYLLCKLPSALTHFWWFWLLLKYTTPSYYTLWDITMARYVSLVPQKHHSRNLVMLLIPHASYWIKLLHVGKVTHRLISSKPDFDPLPLQI